MAQQHTLLGTGIYPLQRAARLVGAELRTVSRWLKGQHSQRFVTDGKKIFLEAVDRAGEDTKLLDVRKQQFAMDAVIRPSLLEGIEYGDGACALRWFPMPKKRLVVLDPNVQFGEPIVAEGAVPTDTLAAAFMAEGENVNRVARLYRVKPQEVKAAVDFEQRLAA